jgi:hypothetical protein
MASVFWDAKGIIHVEFMPWGITVTHCDNCVGYSQDIRHKVCFFSMTVQLHTAHVGQEELLHSFCWELLDHPHHSPVPAPSDFHLFGPRKQHLGQCQFQSNEEVEMVVGEWLRIQETDSYCNRIFNLVPRLTNAPSMCSGIMLKSNDICELH